MRSSPVITFSLYIIFIALAAGVASAVGDSDVLLRTRKTSRWLRPWVERERDMAAALGWSARTWGALRVAAVLGAFLCSLPLGIPIVMVAAPVAAAFAVPYLLAGRAATLQLRRERALVDWVRTVVSRMERNQGIDVVLRDSGVHPPYGLEPILAPLADTSLLIDEALVEVAGRARVPEAEMLTLALLASRTRRQEDLVALLERVVLPVMEAKLDEQVDALEATTQKRSQAVAMSLILLSMFFALVRVDVIRHGFATIGGQILLVVTAASFALVLVLVSRLYRIRTFTRWDLERYRQELRDVGSV